MRVRLVAGAGARARGADEHVVLHLLAVLFAVRCLLPDPGAVALDDLAVDRRGPIHGVLKISPVDLARLLVLAVVDHDVAGALGVAAVAASPTPGILKLETNRVAARGQRGNTNKRHRAGPTARL